MLAVYSLTPVTLLTEIILKKHFQAFLDQKHALVEYPDALASHGVKLGRTTQA